MKTRCALKILFRIRNVFPKEKSIAQSIIEELEKIGDDIQKDIKTLASRYQKNLEDLMPKMKDSKKIPVQTEEKKKEEPPPQNKR